MEFTEKLRVATSGLRNAGEGLPIRPRGRSALRSTRSGFHGHDSDPRQARSVPRVYATRRETKSFDPHGMRRMTRLTNAFSKKWENLRAAYAIWFAFFNFCRVHKTLRVTPAMEAGIADHVWSVRELLTNQ